jgi:hypothetical protein
MEGTLYQVVAALISVTLITIIWYFWNDPGQWRKFKKEFKDASIGLMADHQHPPNVAAFPLRSFPLRSERPHHECSRHHMQRRPAILRAGPLKIVCNKIWGKAEKMCSM